jgi:hypothetical protein
MAEHFQRIVGVLRSRLTHLAIFGLLICAAWKVSAEVTPAPAAHPLDPALEIARERLEFLKQNVRDYTCTIVKRERVDGELGDYQYMAAKIRQRRESNGKVEAPFSVYLKFLKPPAVAGREVIWVEGANDGNFVVHEAGILNIKRLWLDPNGRLAMRGQRYPISEIGMQNLAEQLIKKGERDRQYAECDVQFFKNAMVNKRPCLMIQVVHPEKRPHFDFHKAQIFIDEKLNVPVRYVAWVWPESPGGEPVLEEEYTYLDVELNVGLTDKDFSPDNSEYNYPRL